MEERNKKTAPEQPKPFEFALMYVEDDDEEENLSINHDNILLRGFVNLVSTDGEADIRSKIGDAIRLKHPLIGNRDFVFLRANRRKLSIPVSCGEEYRSTRLRANSQTNKLAYNLSSRLRRRVHSSNVCLL